MKKILIIVCCCFAGGLGYIGYKTINPSPLEIDPLNDISIEASGYDGDGEVKVNTDNIPYPSKRYVKKFYETISYTVSPNKELKNGDKVVVTIKYDKDMASRKNITIKRKSKTFKVSSLKKGYEEYKGVKVPLGLSKEEKEKLYQSGMASKISDKSENPEDVKDDGIHIPEEELVYKGQLDAETHKTNQTFDYYNDAYNYGLQSSQSFKIETVVNNGATKFECEFVNE